MVAIHYATAEIRQGKNEEETGPKYNVRICYAGHHKNVQAKGCMSGV